VWNKDRFENKLWDIFPKQEPWRGRQANHGATADLPNLYVAAPSALVGRSACKTPESCV